MLCQTGNLMIQPAPCFVNVINGAVSPVHNILKCLLLLVQCCFQLITFLVNRQQLSSQPLDFMNGLIQLLGIR
ncbi:hypothetical protein D3C86_2084810 [compost metagenome]